MVGAPIRGWRPLKAECPLRWLSMSGLVQVTQADAPVMLGGPRERVLLAALLVEHGRVVSVDGLTQALVLGGDHR